MEDLCNFNIIFIPMLCLNYIMILKYNILNGGKIIKRKTQNRITRMGKDG